MTPLARLGKSPTPEELGGELNRRFCSTPVAPCLLSPNLLENALDWRLPVARLPSFRTVWAMFCCLIAMSRMISSGLRAAVRP
jgi:hypothetical protein